MKHIFINNYTDIRNILIRKKLDLRQITINQTHTPLNNVVGAVVE